MDPILRVLLVPLAATIVVESSAAALLGLRSGREQGVVAAMNAMTNPPLVFLVLLARGLGLHGPLLVAVLECAVVLVEWRVLRWALEGRLARPFATSLALNAASLAAGLALGVVLPVS